MQTTKIIGNIDRVKNVFTRQGRKKNGIIKKLEKRGFIEFRERTLKDKSQVMLAYRTGKKLASFAYRFFPDLTIEKKESGQRTAFFSKSLKVQFLFKSLRDKNGKTIKAYQKKMRYENDKFIKKEEIISDRIKDVLIKKEEIVKKEDSPNLQLNNKVKSYVKIKGNDIYSFYQSADGTRNYTKNINNIEYKFSSK